MVQALTFRPFPEHSSIPGSRNPDAKILCVPWLASQTLVLHTLASVGVSFYTESAGKHSLRAFCYGGHGEPETIQLQISAALLEVQTKQAQTQQLRTKQQKFPQPK